MKRDFDIAQNIRAVEGLKVRLLSGVARTFETARSAHSQEEAADSIAEVIMSAYLLAEKEGTSPGELDERIVKLLRLEILKDEGLKRESAELAEYVRARGGNSGQKIGGI